MATTISALLQKSFELRSRAEKLQIIRLGKPRPVKFDLDLFDKEQWLTACDKRNAFYCWTCLLFFPETQISGWNARYFNSERLLFAFGEHKRTNTHIDGVFKLQSFLDQNIVEVTVPNEVSVRKNRQVLKHIVDVVCHLTSVKIPVYNGGNLCDQYLVQDCTEYLSALKTDDLHSSLDEAINLIETGPKILTDVMSTLANSIMSEIKSEVQTSSYMSLICSEHSDTDLKNSISYVLRYVNDGKVRERFIGFIRHNSAAYKSENIMESHILEILIKFSIGKRLLGFSCDGSVMSAESIKKVITSLKSNLPILLFLPCYYHDFDLVLEQTLSIFNECRLFFHALSAIKSYVQGSSKIRQMFNSFMGDKIPDFSDFKKLSESHFVRILRLHRKEFVNFFTSIENNSRDYTVDDVAKVSGLAAVLTNIETIFLLELFNTLFERTAIFSETLSSCYPENVFEEDVIENLKTSIRRMIKNGDFARAWDTSTQGLPDDANLLTEQCKRSCEILYYKIMCHLEYEIEIRLEGLKTLNFVNILNSQCQGKFVLYDEHFQNLVKTYGDCFGKTSLGNELCLINQHESALLGKSVHHLLEQLVSMELQSVFKNVAKLAELILAMPCKPLDPQCSTSTKYENIKAWANVVRDEGMLNDFSVLAVENDFLLHIKSQAKFCDEFMNTFQKLNNTLQVT